MTIKLQQAMQAIEKADDVYTLFLDTKTGETVYLSDPFITGETDEALADEIENTPDQFLRFPTKYEIHEFSIIEAFVEQIPTGKAQNGLASAIRGKGAFRRFKQTIRFYGMEQLWYDFLADAHREIAVRWCQNAGLEYIE